MRAVTRRRLYREERIGAPTLGFLDINFGVLGIFLIIFAIRIVMVLQQSGIDADVMLYADTSEREGKTQTRTMLYFRDIETPIEVIASGGGAKGNGRRIEMLAEQLVPVLKAQLAEMDRPLRMLILIPPNELDAEWELRQALSDLRTKAEYSYIAFVLQAEPILGSAQVADRIKEWRDAN